MEFTFHPLCRSLRLTHLCFADDLLMFCRGDRTSIIVILRAFATFSMASGLVMNSEKSDIYFNGMRDEEVHYILNISSFREGHFPFRYLGIPISHKRMAIGDCSRLVDKVVMRIRGWGARKLSYAERLVLVQAVLTQLHNFWARIFLFPVTVLDRIERICRNYLLGGSEQFHKMPNVAWEKICRDRKHGGLGIMHGRNWNLAMLGKFVWWLVSKADHMWIKWVNHIYIKGQDWLTYTPPIHSSWSWRMICKTKDKMKDSFCTGFWNEQNIYSAAKGYTWLQGSQIKVPWYPLIWNKVNSPKHAFIGWLAVQQNLMTKDRLLKYGIITDGRCDLCLNHIETHQHILYECVFSAMCWSALKTWVGINMPNVGILEWSIHWLAGH
ncbi:uncharacterized protein LOC141651687 [Silene latifolia]|uniref:uncharacterized protein LOC141651687 n=1 Tax=Silene latifolia TaxID=37657 RepID=UPI003D7801A5